MIVFFFFFQAEDGIRDFHVTGVQTCALPILVQGGMQVMQAMIEVSAETNLVTGLLTAGALTNQPGILALLEDRFTASARRAEKQLAKLPAGAKFEPLKEKVRGLAKLANFKPREESDDSERLQQVFRAHEQLNYLLIGLI